MIQTPPEWARPAVNKILKMVVKQTPDGGAACDLLANLLLLCQTHVFEGGDKHAAALALAAAFTEAAEELAAREKRQ
jgi:hypothetical protein